MKKTTKKLGMTFSCVLLIIISVFMLNASAADSTGGDNSFKCGKNVTWNYDAKTYTITISGKGDMDEYVNQGWNIDLYIDCRDNAKKVIIEDGVTSMSKLLFTQFINLESVKLSEDISVVSYGCFGDCSELKKVVLPKKLKKIDEHAFSYCSSLNSISLPDSVEVIGNNAFESAWLSGELILPASLKEIGYCAFYECTHLTKIVVPAGVKKIENNTFVTYATVVILNRNCEIYDGEMAIYGGVSGYIGSTAQEYALKYNKPFEPLPEHDHKYTSKVTKKATCSKKGVKTYTCSCGYSYTKAIAKTEHTYESKVTKATHSKNGKIVKTCKNCGYKTSSVVAQIKTIKLSATTFIYDSKEKKPSVSVKDSDGKTIKSTYYTVTYSGNKKSVGTYSVKITFKGNYSGSKTLKYKIVLGQVTGIKTVKNGKGLDVVWNKVKGATGYILEEYDTKSGKFVEKKRVKENTLNKQQLDKITITIRIRAYYVRDGKTYYGDYSANKKIKV